MALNKHMQAAVDEISGDIAQLQQEIEQLKMVTDCIDRLYGGEEPAEPETAKEKRSKAKGSAAGSALEKAAGKRVPFTAENLVTAVGFSKQAARSLLQRGKAAGWLESTDRGQYRKTDKFPATVIPAE